MCGWPARDPKLITMPRPKQSKFPLETTFNSAITAMLLTLPELDLPVVLSDFYLEHLEADNVGRQTTETLPPAASNSNQQHVATRLGNNTDYAGHCAERNEYVSQIDH